MEFGLYKQCCAIGSSPFVFAPRTLLTEEIVMHAPVRPFVTTGVALVGASVIAATPIAPPPTANIRIAAPAVQLTAVESPFEFYPMVVQATLENAGILAQRYLAQPFPIIQAILGNEVIAPTDIFTALGWVGYSAVSWAVAGALSALHSAWEIVNAVVTLNPIDFISAVLNVPARIVDGVLNGYTINLGPVTGDVTGLLFGLTGSLIQLDQAIGAAISGLFHPSSTPLARVDEPPTPGATTLTLSTGSSLDSGPTPADQGLSTAGSGAAAPAQQGLATAAAAAANAEVAAAEANASEQAAQGLADATEGSNATKRLDTADATAPSQADQGLDTARAAATTERPGGRTDLTDGNKVTPGQPPTANPTEHASDALEDVQERVAEKTSHAGRGLANARDHVENAGPSGSAANTGASADDGE
jgi:hypothetical protein